jgi:glycosyltransferase involved in cell wall biosynthesis
LRLPIPPTSVAAPTDISHSDRISRENHCSWPFPNASEALQQRLEWHYISEGQQWTVTFVDQIPAATASMKPSTLPGNLLVVMPAFNAERFLAKSLAGWLEQTPNVLVVDPGSDDATAKTARSMGACVTELGHRAGPAEARNAGVAAASDSAEIILFADADCAPAPDVVTRIRDAFEAAPDMVSLTGSYDDNPSQRNFASLYMNLRHYAVHQVANRENATFWAGCGAVRRSAFVQVGGFDKERYPHPMIEDIDLGLRLRAVGRTCLDPTLQVKHLKHWQIGSVIRTDILHRAIPWSDLILRTKVLPNDLNLTFRARIAAAVAPLALLSVLAVIVSAVAGRYWLCLGLTTPIIASVCLNAHLLRVFARVGGVPFTIAAWAFHQLHLIISAAIFAWCLATRRHRKT